MLHVQYKTYEQNQENGYNLEERLYFVFSYQWEPEYIKKIKMGKYFIKIGNKRKFLEKRINLFFFSESHIRLNTRKTKN